MMRDNLKRSEVLPKYIGRTSFKDFTDAVELTMALESWDPQQTSKIVMYRLERLARQIATRIMVEVTPQKLPWPSFKNRLKPNFIREPSGWKCRATVTTRVQGPNKSVADYFNDKINKINTYSAEIHNIDLVTLVLEGLKADLRDLINQTRFNQTLNRANLLEILVECEATLKVISSRGSPVQLSKPSNHSSWKSNYTSRNYSQQNNQAQIYSPPRSYGYYSRNSNFSSPRLTTYYSRNPSQPTLYNARLPGHSQWYASKPQF